MQSIDWIETYADGRRKDLVSKKNKRLSIIQYSIINTNNWRLWSRKSNSLCNLINPQLDIDKTHLYAKRPYETKYQVLIYKREITGLKHFNNSKPFIKFSNDMYDSYENIEKRNPNKKRKN